MSHLFMSHVTRIHESCCTYSWPRHDCSTRTHTCTRKHTRAHTIHVHTQTHTCTQDTRKVKRESFSAGKIPRRTTGAAGATTGSAGTTCIRNISNNHVRTHKARCNTPQHTATHTATHCNTLQHKVPRERPAFTEHQA